LQPSVYTFPDVTIAALPWTPATTLAAAHPGENRDQLNELAADSLVQGARMMSERCRSEYPGTKTLLLGHWAISGSVLPTGLDVSLLREPVIDLDGLTQSGFDLAMFGHIHLAGMLATGPTPVGYTGAPWVNSWGETTGEHGVWIYDSAGAGALRFVPVADPKKFLTFEPTASDLIANDGQMEGVAQEGHIVRVKYTATEEEARKIDQAAVRANLLACGATRVIFKATIQRAERAREASMSEDLGEKDALELWLSSQQVADPLASDMRRVHEEFLGRVA
jgi:DNA repair exonuclease SbcCD nuclease subunit